MPRIILLHQLKKFVRSQNATFDPTSPSYRWWLLANVMIGTFMAVLDATIVNVGLPKIMASFGVGIDKIEWVLTAYMLAMAVMLPTAGWMADKFGYKRVYFLGLFLFTFGSFLCGISPTEDILIFSRVIQGLGAGALIPVGMAIITREFPPQQRGIALGFWSVAAAASVSFGPMIGGYLVDTFNWPLIFDVNIPVGVAGMLATAIIQKEFRNPKIRSFDLIGFFSASIFLPVLLYALTEGNASTNSSGWHAPYILLCFAVSAIAFTVFIINELLVADPLIELRLLAKPSFGITNLVIFIFGIGMFGSTFLLPLYLQNSLGYTALQSGAVFLPVGIIQGIIAPIAGFSSDKINPKIPVIIGSLLLATSFFLNSTMSYLTEHSFIMTSLYIRGLAMGMMFSPLNTIAFREVPREKMAQASGITNIVRQVGGSFGVAILTTILTTRVIYHAQMFGRAMDSNSPAYQMVSRNLGHFISGATGSVSAIATQQSQYLLFSHLNRQAFIQGIDDDFLVAAILTAISILPVFFLRLRKKKAEVKPVR